MSAAAIEGSLGVDVAPYSDEHVQQFKLMMGKGYEPDENIDVLQLCDEDLRRHGIVMEAGYSEYSQYQIQMRQLLTLERNPVKRQLYAMQLAVLQPHNLEFNHLWKIVPLSRPPFMDEQ